jgi:hypothetical protein
MCVVDDRTSKSTRPADFTWATKALQFDGKPTHTELVDVVNGISKLIADRNTSVLADILLRLLASPNLRLDVMVAALRGSVPARSQISHWKEIVSRARHKVVKEGRNPDTLLRGLD